MALIVVMEDDAGTRMLIASVLRKDGHEVLAAENGAQGLALVQSRNPQLIISDVQMPEMNGFQMLAAVRQDPALATTPVILLTSLQERAHMRIGMTTGADDYITKPFRPAELREAASAQLNKRVMQATLQSMAVDAAVQAALVEQKHQLAKLYEQRLASELSDRWPSGDGSEDDREVSQCHGAVRGISPTTHLLPRETQSHRAHRTGQEVLRQRQRHGPPVWRAPHPVHRRRPAGGVRRRHRYTHCQSRPACRAGRARPHRVGQGYPPVHGGVLPGPAIAPVRGECVPARRPGHAYRAAGPPSRIDFPGCPGG
jgi:DNA-binding response OmpR family regulator